MPYQCDNCGAEFESADELDFLRDATTRIEPGELMPAGECPDCGGVVHLPDEEVPEYTLHAVAFTMRKRGWTVQEP